MNFTRLSSSRVQLHGASVSRRFSCNGVQLNRVELHKGSVKWGSVTRGSVARGFSYAVFQLQWNHLNVYINTN